MRSAGLTVAGLVVAFGVGAASTIWGYWTLLPAAVVVVLVVASGVWRRGEKSSEPTNWVLVVLPTVLAGTAINFLAGLALTAVLAVVVLWMKPVSRLSWRCAILPLVGLVIVLRPNYPATMITAAFFVLACVVVVRAVTLPGNAFTSLTDGIGLFLATSVALRLVGFQGGVGRTAGLDNTLTGGLRVTFPLTDSLAVTPGMAAIYLVAVVPMLFTPHRRFPRLAAVGCAVYVITLADSRAALIGALLLAATVLLLPKLFRVLTPWIVTGALVLPFLYNPITGWTWLTRPGEKAGTLNGRDRIWTHALTFYTDRIDPLHQAIGYGTYGQAASGASSSWNQAFEGYGADRRLITPHNSVLQILFDGGWMTVAVVAVVLIVMAWKLRTNLVGLAMLVALTVVGVTEVALSPGHAQSTWWVLLALSTATFMRPNDGVAPQPGQGVEGQMSVAEGRWLEA